MTIDRRRFLRVSCKAIGQITSSRIFARPTSGFRAFAESSMRQLSDISPKTTLLFFDDWPLDRRDNVELRSGHPEARPELTFLDSGLNLAWSYPSVFRVSGTGGWRMLYQGWDAKEKRLYPLVAESVDGLRWSTPDLSSRIPLPDRRRHNQVLPLTEFTEWSPCYYDQRAPQSERLKGLVFWKSADGLARTRLWVSPDGFEWRRVDGVEWQHDAPDPVSCVFWDEHRSKYVITTRPRLNDRRIAVVETADWRAFSEPEIALEADALDTPLAQLYGMPVFPYSGHYVAMLWIYHVPAQVRGQSPLKFLGGKLDSQLAFSRDGWHFQRCLRSTFIPNAVPGELGAGCLQPCCLSFPDEKSIRIYACGTRQEHGILSAGDGGILIFTLRKDGFAYLEPEGGTGIVGTRPLLWNGGQLQLNILAPEGEVRAQVTDISGQVLPGYSFGESKPFSGDDVSWTPFWNTHLTLRDIPRRALRLEVQLRNARLYSIRGDFQVITAAETDRYERLQEVPKRLISGYL